MPQFDESLFDESLFDGQEGASGVATGVGSVVGIPTVVFPASGAAQGQGALTGDLVEMILPAPIQGVRVAAWLRPGT